MVTPRGYAVAAAGAASGVAGWLLGYPELAVVSAGCLAALGARYRKANVS